MFVRLVVVFILFHSKLLPVNAMKIPIPGTNHDSTHVIYEIAANILSNCYSDNKEVVIHGDSDALVVKSLREIESLAVIIYNDPPLVDEPLHLRLHKNSFVMTPNSISQLANMLQTFKHSERWNVRAPHIILDKSNRQCENARKMLKTAWRMNLIESFFLCMDSESVPMVYTYNPYTNRAPKTWKRVQSSTKPFDGWTMFAYSHHDKNFCEEMTFDRTKHLDGSIIRVATPTLNSKVDGKIIPKLYDVMAYTLRRLEYSLNVSLEFYIPNSDQLLFQSVIEGSTDVLMLLTLSDERMTYPVCYVSYHIVTNNRGLYTPIENIMNYYGVVTLVSMCVILPMTFIVILLSQKTRRWAFSAFEILRLLINGALHTRMDTIALRIFFSVIFLYFLIIHATFQGHVTSFLMKQEYRKNAETLTDLQSSRYEEIQLQRSLRGLISDPILVEKLLLIGEDCVSGVIGKASTASICDPRLFFTSAFEDKLHVSQNPVFIVPNSHLIRDDWPLRERFDLFLMWLASTGQSTQDYEARLLSRVLETQRRKSAKAELEEIRPITLSMLEFFFIFLAIGLKVALMSFAVERRVRPEATRISENERAALMNQERRRCEIINRIISDPTLVAGSRPRTV